MLHGWLHFRACQSPHDITLTIIGCILQCEFTFFIAIENSTQLPNSSFIRLLVRIGAKGAMVRILVRRARSSRDNAFRPTFAACKRVAATLQVNQHLL